MPEEAREKGMSELKKLRMMAPASAEYAIVRNYVDWILELPWNDMRETSIDIPEARAILDADHFGLEKPKQRILEFLAVQKLTNALKGPILCLVGPPGVGKTSLARSVATATGREYVRLSLGGVRDEAEIRGHRRTYVGAMPGKIIMALKRAKSSNPLFCLDEIDKMSSDYRAIPRPPCWRYSTRAEQDLQRPLSRHRLRPVEGVLHHHGELAAQYSRSASGPYGNH